MNIKHNYLIPTFFYWCCLTFTRNVADAQRGGGVPQWAPYLIYTIPKGALSSGWQITLYLG
ncbi:MAG: hypothetical protein JWR67_3875 [Mucilaginibacter sp.]|nr:hypothetical protein [Mucilaginibacter sp.]